MTEGHEVFLRPRRQLSNPAAEFIENRVVISGAPPMQYVQEIDTFGTVMTAKEVQVQIKDAWSQVAEDKANLINSIETFRDKKKNKLSSDLRQFDPAKCTWKDVQTELGRAVTHHQERQTPAKIYLDKLGKHEKDIGAWLDLLPSGDYGSPVCGVLKVILGAAGRFHEVEDSVFKALQDIPYQISRAIRTVRSYGVEEAAELHCHMVSFYGAVLRAYTNIMSYFTRRTGHKIFKAFVYTDNYEKAVVDSVLEVEECSQTIAAEAMACLHARSHKLETFNREILRRQNSNSQTQSTATSVQPTSTSTPGSNKPQLIEDAEIVEETVEGLANLALETSNPAEFNIAIPEAKRYLYQTLYALLRSNPDLDKLTGFPSIEGGYQMAKPAKLKKKKTKKKTHKYSPAPGPDIEYVQHRCFTVDDLLDLLHYDLKMPLKNISEVLSDGGKFEQLETDQANYVLGAPKLRKWLTESKKSRFLLVNGNFPNPDEMISPLSFVCAKFARIYSSLPSAIVLSYFCGVRAVEDMDDMGPIDMLQSLITQLLARSEFEFELSFVKKATRKGLADGNLQSLLRTFRLLVVQLPKNTVIFCFVDMISTFEIQLFEEDMQACWEMFSKLIGSKAGVVFKLLVTEPGQIAIDQKHLDDVFEVPEDFEGEGYGVLDDSGTD